MYNVVLIYEGRTASNTLSEVLDQCQDRQVQERTKSHQQVAREGKLPIEPVTTRWSSKIYSMEVLLEIEPFVRLSIPNPPGDSDWGLLKRCVERLRPVVTATEDVEQDSASVVTVLRNVELIKEHWSNQGDMTTFHTPALGHLDKRCAKHFSGGVYSVA
eukprot:GGOE01007558.1.p1 GENE.GGOE01007558.1~~GGOE01007558.1.p1  ORF type:complete len:174 (-),score=7.38 GGOE01007558.1:646-1122(-)